MEAVGDLRQSHERVNLFCSRPPRPPSTNTCPASQERRATNDKARSDSSKLLHTINDKDKNRPHSMCRRPRVTGDALLALLACTGGGLVCDRSLLDLSLLQLLEKPECRCPLLALLACTRGCIVSNHLQFELSLLPLPWRASKPLVVRHKALRIGGGKSVVL